FREGGVTRRLDALGDLVHGPVERFGLVPLAVARSAVPNSLHAIGIDRELVGRRPLGTERAATDGAVRVAFDVDDGAVADGDKLAAADGAVRANAGHLAGVGELET